MNIQDVKIRKLRYRRRNWKIDGQFINDDIVTNRAKYLRADFRTIDALKECQEMLTTWNTFNARTYGNMFDVKSNQKRIYIHGFDIMSDTGIIEYEVHTRPGSYLRNPLSLEGWVMIHKGSTDVVNGTASIKWESSVELDKMSIQAFYVTLTTNHLGIQQDSTLYSGAAFSGNENLDIHIGIGVSYPLGNLPMEGVLFAGKVYFETRGEECSTNETSNGNGIIMEQYNSSTEAIKANFLNSGADLLNLQSFSPSPSQKLSWQPNAPQVTQEPSNLHSSDDQLFGNSSVSMAPTPMLTSAVSPHFIPFAVLSTTPTSTNHTFSQNNFSIYPSTLDISTSLMPSFTESNVSGTRESSFPSVTMLPSFLNDTTISSELNYTVGNTVPSISEAPSFTTTEPTSNPDLSTSQSYMAVSSSPTKDNAEAPNYSTSIVNFTKETFSPTTIYVTNVSSNNASEAPSFINTTNVQPLSVPYFSEEPSFTTSMIEGQKNVSFPSFVTDVPHYTSIISEEPSFLTTLLEGEMQSSIPILNGDGVQTTSSNTSQEPSFITTIFAEPLESPSPTQITDIPHPDATISDVPSFATTFLGENIESTLPTIIRDSPLPTSNVSEEPTVKTTLISEAVESSFPSMIDNSFFPSKTISEEPSSTLSILAEETTSPYPSHNSESPQPTSATSNEPNFSPTNEARQTQSPLPSLTGDMPVPASSISVEPIFETSVNIGQIESSSPTLMSMLSHPPLSISEEPSSKTNFIGGLLESPFPSILDASSHPSSSISEEPTLTTGLYEGEIESPFPTLIRESLHPTSNISVEPSVLEKVEKTSPVRINANTVTNIANAPSFITGSSFPTAITLIPHYINMTSEAPSVRTTSPEGTVEYNYSLVNSDQPSFSQEELEMPNESSTSIKASIHPVLNPSITKNPSVAMGAMEESDGPVSPTNFPKEPIFLTGNSEEPLESSLPMTNYSSSPSAQTLSQEPYSTPGNIEDSESSFHITTNHPSSMVTTLSPSTVDKRPLLATNNSSQQNFPIAEAPSMRSASPYFPMNSSEFSSTQGKVDPLINSTVNSYPIPAESLPNEPIMSSSYVEEKNESNIPSFSNLTLTTSSEIPIVAMGNTSEPSSANIKSHVDANFSLSNTKLPTDYSVPSTIYVGSPSIKTSTKSPILNADNTEKHVVSRIPVAMQVSVRPESTADGSVGSMPSLLATTTSSSPFLYSSEPVSTVNQRDSARPFSPNTANPSSHSVTNFPNLSTDITKGPLISKSPSIPSSFSSFPSERVSFEKPPSVDSPAISPAQISRSSNTPSVSFPIYFPPSFAPQLAPSSRPMTSVSGVPTRVNSTTISLAENQSKAPRSSQHSLPPTLLPLSSLTYFPSSKMTRSPMLKESGVPIRNSEKLGPTACILFPALCDGATSSISLSEIDTSSSVQSLFPTEIPSAVNSATPSNLTFHPSTGFLIPTIDALNNESSLEQNLQQESQSPSIETNENVLLLLPSQQPSETMDTFNVKIPTESNSIFVSLDSEDPVLKDSSPEPLPYTFPIMHYNEGMPKEKPLPLIPIDPRPPASIPSATISLRPSSEMELPNTDVQDFPFITGDPSLPSSSAGMSKPVISAEFPSYHDLVGLSTDIHHVEVTTSEPSLQTNNGITGSPSSDREDPFTAPMIAESALIPSKYPLSPLTQKNHLSSFRPTPKKVIIKKPAYSSHFPIEFPTLGISESICVLIPAMCLSSTMPSHSIPSDNSHSKFRSSEPSLPLSNSIQPGNAFVPSQHKFPVPKSTSTPIILISGISTSREPNVESSFPSSISPDNPRHEQNEAIQSSPEFSISPKSQSSSYQVESNSLSSVSSKSIEETKTIDVLDSSNNSELPTPSKVMVLDSSKISNIKKCPSFEKGQEGSTSRFIGFSYKIESMSSVLEKINYLESALLSRISRTLLTCETLPPSRRLFLEKNRSIILQIGYPDSIPHSETSICIPTSSTAQDCLLVNNTLEFFYLDRNANKSWVMMDETINQTITNMSFIENYIPGLVSFTAGGVSERRYSEFEQTFVGPGMSRKILLPVFAAAVVLFVIFILKRSKRCWHVFASIFQREKDICRSNYTNIEEVTT